MVVKKIGFAQERAYINSGYQTDWEGRRIQQFASFACKDIGMDCPFEAQAVTHHELMKKFIDHAGSAHNLQVLSADVIYKMQNAIKK
ncbi:MAG: DUF1059 domain-containing protein [Methanoregula sp.]|jgi:predicted small metal-binding protein|nr:DUF1059 domain-containing protein [Methanoregula sp.]